jgi:hypothetical protein
VARGGVEAAQPRDPVERLDLREGHSHNRVSLSPAADKINYRRTGWGGTKQHRAGIHDTTSGGSDDGAGHGSYRIRVVQ